MEDEQFEVKDIGNYYGGLHVMKKISPLGDRYYWSIENYSGHSWFEIEKELYVQLKKRKREET